MPQNPDSHYQEEVSIELCYNRGWNVLDIFRKRSLSLCSSFLCKPKELVGEFLLISFISLKDDQTTCAPLAIMTCSLAF